MIEKEGLLRKRVNYFRVYQKFYVILRDGRLDLLNEKTRELQSSIALSGGFTVSELMTTHAKPVGHATQDSVAFSIFNGDNLLAKFMAGSSKEATEWKMAIEKSIKLEEKRPKAMRRKRSVHTGDQPEYVAKKFEIVSKVDFEVVDSVAGLPVYREVKMTRTNVLLKSGCVVNDTADNVCNMILNDNVGEAYDRWEESMEVLSEDAEKHQRIEYVRWYPIKVNCLFTKPRDFVLQRYWMSSENGSKLILWRSCTHPDRPEDPNYVRANIWVLGFLITPRKRVEGESEIGGNEDQCWVDMCIHFDPGSWLSKMPKYFHQQWAYSILQRLSLLRECVNRKKFIDLDYTQVFKAFTTGNMASAGGSSRNLLGKSSARLKAVESEHGDDSLRGSWADWVDCPLDREPLQVRGPNYLTDGKKVECREAAFRMVAADLFETEGRVVHIAGRPDSLVHRLVKEGGHPFIFVVHFALPGPPFYSLVGYFAAKPEDMTVGNPFGDLLNKFLNSDSEFRKKVFKFIPRVVEGNFFVRKAVGTTPAILGKKLELEFYGDGETYFEVVVDVGSSSIAGSILSVVKGYATSLCIDLAFLLEGQTSDTLPEKILGALRLVHPDIGKAKKLPFFTLPDVSDSAESDSHAKKD